MPESYEVLVDEPLNTRPIMIAHIKEKINSKKIFEEEACKFSEFFSVPKHLILHIPISS